MINDRISNFRIYIFQNIQISKSSWEFLDLPKKFENPLKYIGNVRKLDFWKLLRFRLIYNFLEELGLKGLNDKKQSTIYLNIRAHMSRVLE